MTTETEVYRDLQRHLDRLPIGFPATESGVDIRVLRHLFTPEEAWLATQLSMLPESLTRVHRRVRKTGTSIEELERSLDQMVQKGLVMSRTRDGHKYYANEMLAIGMYEHQVDRMPQGFVEDMLQYLDEAFGVELYRTRIPQLRTVPVERGIPQEHRVATYDSIREIVGAVEGQMVVANCICRQAKDRVGESCHQTDLRETCLIFGRAAEHYLDMGLARSITKEEALTILNQAQEAGLVLQPINSQRPEAVCCCCGDCCGLLMSAKKHPKPSELYASSYYAEVDAGRCNACASCVDRCQLQAATLINDVCVVDRDRCIGCGVCAAGCNLKAIHLRKKETATVPPVSTGFLYKKILTTKIGRWRMVKLGVKRLARMQV
ncbi:MAG: 4Fe-4S ferredoxin [Chloroflexi bacterium]|nr:4Fe-4S ferredoxin [Chloroflexota bacterium]